MNADGPNQVCLTCGKPQLSHLSNDQPAWTSDGKYVAFQSIDAALFNAMPMPEATKEQFTEGGAGIDNNLWLTPKDGSAFWQLTHVAANEGVLHPHFSPDGKELFWGARINRSGPPAGRAREGTLRIADFVVDASGPHLANIRDYQPLGRAVFYESHDW